MGIFNFLRGGSTRRTENHSLLLAIVSFLGRRRRVVR